MSTAKIVLGGKRKQYFQIKTAKDNTVVLCGTGDERKQNHGHGTGHGKVINGTYSRKEEIAAAAQDSKI